MHVVRCQVAAPEVVCRAGAAPPNLRDYRANALQLLVGEQARSKQKPWFNEVPGKQDAG